jgi:glycosyltransferase involved in cell wall biosynthesis
MARLMRIALFDYSVIPTNPVGGLHHRLLSSLSVDHDFTVFAVEFDNPVPERIRWVRVPVPRRPLALQFLSFHVAAPICYLVFRLRRRFRFDLVHIVESNLLFGDLSEAHFCHRAFLRNGQLGSSGMKVRRMLRSADHKLHAALEPFVFRRVRQIVVPSRGLGRELEAEYPEAAGKVTVISNPVDLARLVAPLHFDREEQRRRLGLAGEDLALVFVALGQFERKGLPLLLEALRSCAVPHLKLLVVGGEADLVRAYEKRVRSLGLGEVVTFLGMQPDIRPFLWASDAFCLPSTYEANSLAVLEAAAAGLPLLVSRLHGVEDVFTDGVSGLFVECSIDGVVVGLKRLTNLTSDQRHGLGQRAREAVDGCTVASYVDDWKVLYKEINITQVGQRTGQ